MKKFIILAFFFLSIFSKAQEIQKASVEKNLNSVQLGLLSLSYQNETKLDRKITLRSEIGFGTGSSSQEYSDGHTETSFLIVPFINAESRWYYGLDRRSRLKRETKNNSSNYISLLTSFVSSDRTALVNTKGFEAAPYINITPEYGIRRGGKHFFSEYSAGVGYRHNFLNKIATYKTGENELNIDFQWKIGYIF